MRRVTGAFAIAIIFFTLLTAGILISITPPDPVIRWLFTSVLKNPIEWQGSDYQNASLRARTIRYPLVLARLEAGEAVIKNGILGSCLRGLWDVDFINIRIVPQNPRWPNLDFASGQAIWRTQSKILELRNWTSKYARLDADIRFGESGRLRSADIRGDADSSELAKALSGWKILNSAGDAERRTFHLSYTQGKLVITVDEKTFFKASWTGSVNF